MRKLIVGLIVFLPVLAFSKDWFLWADNPLGKVSISENISKDSLDRYQIWTKYEDKNLAKKIRTAKLLYVIDCNNKQVGMASLKDYDKNGKLISEKSISPLMAPMETPDPDDFKFKLMEEVCRQNGE